MASINSLPSSLPSDELWQEIEKDSVFYAESGGGVTFSGGEPLLQPEFLLEILKKCKSNNIHTTLDTSGYASRQIIKKILPYTDLFLYDLKNTEVSHKIILSNLKLLIDKGKNVIIRFPVIPQITDSYENTESIRSLLLSIKKDWIIHLLPYHNIAKNKYKRLGKEDNLNVLEEVDQKKFSEIEEIFANCGFQTVIGG